MSQRSSTPEPEWLEELLDCVEDAIGGCTFMSPLGYVWCPPESPGDSWVVHCFPTPVEIFGGPRDGRRIFPGLHLDVISLAADFDDIESAEWHSPRKHSVYYEGPGILITGVFADHQVVLGVFANSPKDEEVRMLVDHERGTLREKPDPSEELE